jgi:hypothetical protein
VTDVLWRPVSGRVSVELWAFEQGHEGVRIHPGTII